MVLSNILENSQTVNISLYPLLIIAALGLGIVFFLAGVIFYLLRKINFLTKMRFGFAGKPLFSLFVFFGIVLAIPITMYASFQTIDFIKLARAKKEVMVEMYSSKKEEDLYEVAFLAVPTIDGDPWLDGFYEVTWYVQGVVVVEKIEKNRSSASPSYFVIDLPPGEYKVKVQVEGDDFNVVKTEDLILADD